MNATRPDCIVVGAGMIGLCVALRLAEAGQRVTILDMAGPLHGTSGTTGALVTANEKRPLAYYELGRASMDEMRAFAEELDGAEWFHDQGHMEWGGTPQADAALEARLAELEPWSYPFTRLIRSEASELEPELRIPEHIESIVLFGEDSIVDPFPMAGAILRRLRGLAVEMEFGTGPLRLQADGAGVELSDGRRLQAASVCVCAGRWTHELLAGVGFTLPLVSPWGRTPEALGFQVITTPLPAIVRRMVRMPGLSIRPTGAGRLMLHGRPEEAQIHTERNPHAWPWDRPLIPPPPQAQALVEKARRILVDGDLLAVQSAAASVRALAFDGLPVVGSVPGKPGLYTIVTHSGIGLAPLLGRLAAGEISGESSAALESFRPDRFLGGDWRTRSSPIRDARPSDAPTN